MGKRGRRRAREMRAELVGSPEFRAAADELHRQVAREVFFGRSPTLDAMIEAGPPPARPLVTTREEADEVFAKALELVKGERVSAGGVVLPRASSDGAG